MNFSSRVYSVSVSRGGPGGRNKYEYAVAKLCLSLSSLVSSDILLILAAALKGQPIPFNFLFKGSIIDSSENLNSIFVLFALVWSGYRHSLTERCCSF